MHKLMILAWMIFFTVSCNSIQRKLVCAQLHDNELKPLKTCDVSFKFNRCRCRCFDFNNWKNLDLSQCSEFPGMTGDAVNYELEACEGIAGFSLEDQALEIRPKVRAMSQIKKDICE